MMKHFIPLFLLTISPLFSLQWQTNYDAACKQAKQENKPLVLLFTGSDWCTWCHKLEGEVLDTPQFSNEMGDKCIFVKLDFPRKHPIDSQTKAQNETLKNKFSIKGFPTIVVLDADQHLLGTTGYRSGGPSAYANHLENFLRK
ncbi:MAG: thioredoxin family protein [Chlamydiia bacterium]|nr:thioredoxin family protein [Chlamydiia bacterium]